MSPDVARAIPELQRRGLLGEAEARLFLRVARGDLVSVYYELRLLLYAGVVLVTAGVGLLVRENLDRLGPVAIAVGLAVAAGACLFWVSRWTLPFSWRAVPSPHVAFDYLLLLGVLLAAADLAYVEATFTPLGPNWPWHLLLTSLAMGAIAVRFDSRIVFSLSLSTFASWRGVSVSVVERGFWSNFEAAARINTAVCGGLFVLLGLLLARRGFKSHFEPVATYLGFILVLLSLASGALTDDPTWSWWAVALLVLGALLAAHSFFRARFPLFAMGALAVYIAVSRIVLPSLDDDNLAFLWFLTSSVGAIFLLLRVHRGLGRDS